MTDSRSDGLAADAADAAGAAYAADAVYDAGAADDAGTVHDADAGDDAGAVHDADAAAVSADPTHVPASPVTGDSGEPFTPGMLPLPRWFAVLAGVCAVALLPWIAYLAVDLPSHARTENYGLAWVGFDLAMFVTLGCTAWAAYRRSTWTEPLATVAAALLVTDAWFDVTSASTSRAFVEAVLSAVLLELPLAVLCACVASNTERLRRRAYRSLWSRMRAAEQRASTPDTITARPTDPRRR